MMWTIFPISSKWPIFPNGRFFLVDHYTVDLFFDQWTFFPWTFFPWTLFPKFGPTVWNSLPDDLRDPACGSDSFKQFLKTILFSLY